MTEENKVAIIGAQNCGKSTSFYYVASRYKMLSHLIGIVHEAARDCPYAINQGADFISQWWILSRQIEREARMQKYYDKVLCDRSVIDSIVYAGVLHLDGKMSLPEYNVICKTAYAWADRYPYRALIYLTPLPIEGDPMRGELSKQDSFQMRIKKRFDDVLSIVGLSNNVIEVTTEDKTKRRARVMEIVGQYFGDE